ncbi:MAG: hypothetical protein HOV97_05235 [Nonomuraea sp.]|nr:hypothetical protein [Nonomuraea sp.]
MAGTPAGQASQIELILTAEPGKRPVGSPIRHFKCSRCMIIYSHVAGPNARKLEPSCPLCKQEITTEQMRLAMQNAIAKVELLEQQNRDLDGHVNIARNFKDATDLLDADDRLFLKTVLYQWRLDKSVVLKVTHSQEGRPNGFIAAYRHSEPEARTFTSIGGSAIAAYYEEATRTIGSAKAMQTLLSAAQHLLPGATS